MISTTDKVRQLEQDIFDLYTYLGKLQEDKQTLIKDLKSLQRYDMYAYTNYDDQNDVAVEEYRNGDWIKFDDLNDLLKQFEEDVK